MSRCNGSSETYEASSIQSSFSRMASMCGLVMTTSSSSSSDCSLWVSMAPIRSSVGVQQVVRMAVAVSAHRHQGGKGGQENGGQHPDGHDHHCLHGSHGSHGGCGRQLAQEEKKVQIGVG
ncbi:hypothetical protein EYF80_003708 [Liparis tanakae]|uniref:Uncharacterized protein n=1 Tax=Liparis tanakae TaxID=230148 RepID=A0A4Z2J7H4_9TELE|nr:hypothetical protein EYF80_003708 [Liparis tanakae]